MKKGFVRVLALFLMILTAVLPVRALACCDIDNKEACDGESIGTGYILGSRVLELLTGERAGARAEEVTQENGLENVEPSSNINDGRTYLIPGGVVFGTRLKEKHLVVSLPDEAGVLKAGDRLFSVEGREVTSLEDIKAALSGCSGKDVEIKVKRDGKELSLSLTPREVSGEYKLGCVLREGAAGIGTITYINPETREFGGLGHGICDSATGEVLEMTGGAVTGVVLGGVIRGEAGKPGELTGILTDKMSGDVDLNTDCGIFGTLNSVPKSVGEPIPCAHRSEVAAGEATIISTLKNGATLKYKVELYDINKNSSGTKSFKIRVTDEALLAISGGIVRGMSGSPIIQNGMLVGAVTHVMIDDPASGYGIFIENMLSAAESQAQPKAA